MLTIQKISTSIKLFKRQIKIIAFKIFKIKSTPVRKIKEKLQIGGEH